MLCSAADGGGGGGGNWGSLPRAPSVRGGGGGGNWGSLPRAPSVRGGGGGGANSTELFHIRSCSSFTSQSSFFKRFVSLDFKSACAFA